MKNILLALAVAALSASADVFYVNNRTGSDEHDGRAPERAFRTFGRAVPCLMPGDTLEIAPGEIYYETLMMRRSGTPGKPIVINGNGAVVSGRETVPKDNWQDLGNGLYLNPNKAQYGALRPRVLNEKEEIISVGISVKPQDLKPGQAVWNKDGITFRAPEGVKPQDLTFFGFYRESGVKFDNHSYITVNDLVSENNANDGFNIHGYCRGLAFNNITARWNGDDGFSMHEDVIAYVRGGHFHHNDYGIQDVGVSRSFFFGILIEDNREIGADLHGGMRSLEDCLIRNNCLMQMRFNGGAQPYRLPSASPMTPCKAFLKNILVTGGGGAALCVSKNADVTAENCSFLNTENGVVIRQNGRLALFASAIANCNGAAVVSNGAFISAANVFFPPKAVVNDKTFEGEDVLTAIADPSSAIVKPAFGSHFSAQAPQVFYNKAAFVPGFAPGIDLPFIPETTPDFMAPLPDCRHDYDFESLNVFSRVYLEPNIASATCTADFSGEQHLSGSHAVRLSCSIPAGQLGKAVLLKLFSVPLQDVRKPLKTWSFSLYGNGQKTPFRLRIRDGQGRSFFGPSMVMDWTGWKRISWQDIALPDMKTPPVELVVDFTLAPSPDGASFETFIDDLFIE